MPNQPRENALEAAADDQSAIWRYMDFAKFVALLEYRALYFSRVNHLGDPFEGSFPTSQPPVDRLLKLLPGVVPAGSIVNLSPDLQRLWEYMRQWMLVCCWYCQDHESAAMWRLYASSPYAVAIKSTVARLRESVDPPPVVPKGYFGQFKTTIGFVRYIDYEKDSIPMSSFVEPIFHKRKAFEHEHELRALLTEIPIFEGGKLDLTRRPDGNGWLVPARLSALIESVYVAPGAPIWYADLVRRVLKQFGVSADVYQSGLDAAPAY